MFRSTRLRPAAAVPLLAVALASCGGGSHGVSSSAIPAAGNANGALANATLRVTIPAPGASTSSTQRRPAYLPASTGSIVVSLTNDAITGGPTLPDNQAFTVAPNRTAAGVTCGAVVSANYTCTLVVPLPPGADGLDISAYSGAGGAGTQLSQVFYQLVVVTGRTNALSVTLNAFTGSITVTPPGAGATGSVAAGFTVTGNATLDFTATALDALGTPFAGQPGTPTLKAFSTVRTVATVSETGSTLALTPVGTGTTSIELFAVNPAGYGAGAITITTAAVTTGATSIPVQSTAGFTPGLYVIDYGRSNQEEVIVSGSSGSSLTLESPPLVAHAIGAPIVDVPKQEDTPGTAQLAFNVTADSTIVALGGCNSSGPACQIDEYSLGTNSFAERPAFIPAGSFPNSELVQFLGFDATNRLYNAEDNDYTIDEFTFNTANQDSNTTAALTVSGNGLDANTNAALGFTVSSNGTSAAAIDASSSGGLNDPVGSQVVAFAPASANVLLGHQFANSGGTDWSAGNIGTQPDVAIMTDSTGTVFGYALALVNLNYGAGSTANNKIGVVSSGGSESSITTGIGGNFGDSGNPIIAWDAADQALIYVDTASGSYHVLEYKYVSGAFQAPTTIDTLTGNAVDITVSRDGEIAVAYTPGNVANAAVRVYSKTSPHTTQDLNIGFANQQVNAIHFFSDDSLLLVGGPSLNTMYDYPSVGGKPTTTGLFSVTPSDTPAGFEAFDAAISN